MIFLRRDRRSVTKFVVLRVGLLFLGAGIWFAGVMIGHQWVTAVAMGVIAIAILMGAYLRRQQDPLLEDDAEGEVD